MTHRPSASAAAGHSTWGVQPATNDWNTATNWSPAAVPTDTANFGGSSKTAIVFDANSRASVNGIVFVAGAPSYTFTFTAPAPHAPALTIAGTGISNESASTQHVVVASSAVGYTQPQLKFTNSATAGGSGMSYIVGPATPQAAGGGVIGFCNEATAGSASFGVTTGAGKPVEPSTVGGEVSFSNSSSAGTARFTIYGTTGTDPDTFGNVVFHDTSTAANAVFTNAGGTMSPGDGGNTQFYDKATGGQGLFHNLGATASGANGGDVAFDGTSSAADGQYHNYAATASHGYGGVTSFNNNSPNVSPDTHGASAGRGMFFNYGAKESGQGGGHTSFPGAYGSATAANGTFVNYGSAASGSASSAGHTIFSISLPRKSSYCPHAGHGVFWNFPGTVAAAPGGYTQFTVYADKGTSIAGSKGPTAGSATFVNLGAVVDQAQGGQTIFSETSSAESAQLIALGGSNGGEGGKILFNDESSGGTASVQLVGNGTLDISHHDQPGLTIGNLELTGGIIAITVATDTTGLVVSGSLTIKAGPVTFDFTSGSGCASKRKYTVLTAPNLSNVATDQFVGNTLRQGSPTFSIAGNKLEVTFS